VRIVEHTTLVIMGNYVSDNSITYMAISLYAAAVKRINASQITLSEKKHLVILVSNGVILPARLAGNANIEEILEDFPITSKCG
jgi:hypothetical protein